MLNTGIQFEAYQIEMHNAIKKQEFNSINKLIERVFSCPQLLNISFRKNKNKISNPLDHNVDITGLTIFYTEINSSLTNDQKVLNRSLDLLIKDLQKPGAFKNFVTNPQSIRCIFILMLNFKLYEDDNHNADIIQLSNLINSLCSEYRIRLAIWMCIVQASFLKQMIIKIEKFLSSQISKIPKSPESQNVSYFAEIVCAFLEILYKSNEQNHRLSRDAFLNVNVMREFEPIKLFKSYLQKTSGFNLLRYPFLFDLKYKQQLLEIQTIFQQKVNVEQGVINMLNGHYLINEHQNLNVLDAIFLVLKVDRNNILDDTLNQLENAKTGLKRPLRVSFNGQPGDDGGGVKKQFFQLIMREIFNENRDMFVRKNKNMYSWINGSSFEAPIMFELLGVIFGLSIYNRILLDVSFPKIIYKKLLGQQSRNSLEDLKQFQPDFYYSFKNILKTTDQLEIMELTFQAEYQVFGEKVSQPLKEGGQFIQLNQQNKYEYVALYSQWIVHKSIDKQFKALKRGFYRVVTGTIIKLFNPDQLERIIRGSEDINFFQLQKGTKYQGGYTQDTPIIKYLWQLLMSLDLKQKKQFLFFVTGSDRSPIGGLSVLKLTVQRQSPDSENLPTAHTCFNILLLPEYSSKQKLHDKIMLAIKNNEGFGLI